MLSWAVKQENIPKEDLRENCDAVWRDATLPSSAKKEERRNLIAERFLNQHALVVSRFHKDERRSYRNLVMRSHRVVQVLTGEFIGVSHNMEIRKSKNTPSSVAIGACTFTDGKKAYEWMDSDPNFMGNDLLSHSHEAWLLPLDESDCTKDGNNIWFLNNIFCQPNQVPDAVKQISALKDGIRKYGARLVVNNNGGIRVRGSSTAPQYIVLIQCRTFQKFYEWHDAPEGQEFTNVVNGLGGREALLFALCPDFPSPPINPEDLK